jgi:hypothetical protein
MPLFTIRFFGDSSTGVEIWVAVGPSKKEWSVLIKRDAREWPLLAALASTLLYLRYSHSADSLY